MKTFAVVFAAMLLGANASSIVRRANNTDPDAVAAGILTTEQEEFLGDRDSLIKNLKKCYKKDHLEYYQCVLEITNAEFDVQAKQMEAFLTGPAKATSEKIEKVIDEIIAECAELKTPKKVHDCISKKFDDAIAAGDEVIAMSYGVYDKYYDAIYDCGRDSKKQEECTVAAVDEVFAVLTELSTLFFDESQKQ